MERLGVGVGFIIIILIRTLKFDRIITSDTERKKDLSDHFNITSLRTHHTNPHQDYKEYH